MLTVCSRWEAFNCRTAPFKGSARRYTVRDSAARWSIAPETLLMKPLARAGGSIGRANNKALRDHFFKIAGYRLSHNCVL